MENKTGFDLNCAIARWRERLAAEGLARETLRELESHLRDGINEWHDKGLLEEEAFWLGVRRLGSVEQIGVEFAKTEPLTIWRTRLFWILVGAISMNLLSHLTQIGWSISATIVQCVLHVDRATYLRDWVLAPWWMLFTPLAMFLLAIWFVRGGAERWSTTFARLGESRMRIGLTVTAVLIGVRFVELGAFVLSNYSVDAQASMHWSVPQILAMLSYPLTFGFLIAQITPCRRLNRI